MQFLSKTNPRNRIIIDNRIVYVGDKDFWLVASSAHNVYYLLSNPRETRNTKDKRKTANCNILYCPIFP